MIRSPVEVNKLGDGCFQRDILAVSKFLFVDTLLHRTVDLLWIQCFGPDMSAQLACTAAQLPQQHTTAGQNADRSDSVCEWKLRSCITLYGVVSG